MACIVVAEDDEDLRELTTRVLRRAGHTVVATADGAQALAAVAAHGPDAVVSDIDMPAMSGVDLCRALRADPATGRLPVLLVSGSLVAGDERPVAAQATAFLRKPFTPRALVAYVDRILTDGHHDDRPPIEAV